MSTNGTEPVVTCKGVVRAYGSGTATVTALDHVTCSVGAGQKVAIVGPSGSGKSTLLHVMGGIDTPTSGAVGWPWLRQGEALRPQHVAVIFQSPSLLPPLDVLENVALPLVLAGVGEVAAMSAAEDALASLSLGSLGAKLPEELSGGQAQRVAVARVLAGSPRLVLADEPTGQLDQRTGAQMLDVLEAAVERLGAALVLTTHDPHVAGRFPTWRMANGRLDQGPS